MHCETNAAPAVAAPLDVAANSSDTRFGGLQANRRHQGGGALRLRCPHCDGLAKLRTSRDITPLYRELRFQCSNVEDLDDQGACGHTFVASLVIERTIVPSARPNPRIKLPIAAPRVRRFDSGAPAPANDD